MNFSLFFSFDDSAFDEIEENFIGFEVGDVEFWIFVVKFEYMGSDRTRGQLADLCDICYRHLFFDVGECGSVSVWFYNPPTNSLFRLCFIIRKHNLCSDCSGRLVTLF